MDVDKNRFKTRIKDHWLQSYLLSGEKPELPEGVVGMRIYGTGLPKEGVFLSREELRDGYAVTLKS